MNELALFAGAGGGILGGKLLGWRTVCAVEYAPYPRSVLLARQRDGMLDRFPIWDDVRTFDGKPWKGRVDIVTGGFPCQDISSANSRAEGLSGARSGLWSEMHRIIGEVKPTYCLIENSPVLRTRGLETVLGDLAELGYNARWGVIGGRHAGAAIKRDRIWILASSNKDGRNVQTYREVCHKNTPEPSFPGQISYEREDNLRLLREWCEREVLAGTFIGSDDVASDVDQLEAIGNGQVPAVVRLAWEVLNQPRPLSRS